MCLVSETHQGREHSGLIAAAHLRTLHSRKKGSCRSAQAESACKAPEHLIAPFLQQNQHRYWQSTATDGTALSWVAHLNCL